MCVVCDVVSPNSVLRWTVCVCVCVCVCVGWIEQQLCLQTLILALSTFTSIIHVSSSVSEGSGSSATCLPLSV